MLFPSVPSIRSSLSPSLWFDCLTDWWLRDVGEKRGMRERERVKTRITKNKTNEGKGKGGRERACSGTTARTFISPAARLCLTLTLPDRVVRRGSCLSLLYLTPCQIAKSREKRVKWRKNGLPAHTCVCVRTLRGERERRTAGIACWIPRKVERQMSLHDKSKTTAKSQLLLNPPPFCPPFPPFFLPRWVDDLKMSEENEVTRQHVIC